MQFFQLLKEQNYPAAYTLLLTYAPIEQLFLYRSFRIASEECCGSTFAKYAKSIDPDYFGNLVALKATLNLGECMEWKDEVAETFPQYKTYLTEAYNVFQTS